MVFYMAETAKGIVTIWKRQIKNWRVTVIHALLNRFFNQLILQYQNIYVRKLGADPVQLGVVNSTANIMATLISSPIGWLQDRYSLKKIFSMGIGLLAIVPLMYALAVDWMMIIPAIMLSAFAMREGACGVICDVTLQSEDRATGRAICEGIGNVPSILAPLLAASIISLFGGITAEGTRPLFWIQFVARSGLFIYVLTQMTEIARPSRKKSSFIADYHEVFKRGTAVKRFILYLSLDAFVIAMVTPFRYPYAYEIKGANVVIIGAMSAIEILVGASLGSWVGRLADRVGRKKAFYLIQPIVSASFVALVLAPRPEFLIIAQAMFGCSMIIRMIIDPSIRAELVPIDCIGRWRGLLQTFAGLVGIPAPIIGGFIWEKLGPEYVFMIATCIELFVRLPILYTIPETLHLKKRKPPLILVAFLV